MKPEDSPSQNLDNISLIYGSPVLPTIEWGIAFLRAKANLIDTVYMPLQSRIISGGSPTSTRGVPEFLREAAKNHLTFYSDLFGKHRPKFTLERDDELTEKTEEEELCSHPIIGVIHLGHQDGSHTNTAVLAVRTNEEVPHGT